MKPRIIYIHGNMSTHWSFGWAPWLKRQLEELGFPTFFETFPDSVIAREKYWIPFMQDHIQIGENDIIIGWSSGGTAAMRYAETHKIKGSILISPCYTDLDDELEKQSGWYDKPWDWQAIKKNQENISLIYGDNDPFISQKEFEFIGAYLTSDITKIPKGEHFIERTQFPEVVERIKAVYCK